YPCHRQDSITIVKHIGDRVTGGETAWHRHEVGNLQCTACLLFQGYEDIGYGQALHGIAFPMTTRLECWLEIDPTDRRVLHTERNNGTHFVQVEETIHRMDQSYNPTKPSHTTPRPPISKSNHPNYLHQ